MATATTEPYRTYTPRPFTRAQRDSTTVLFGGLHWRLERLLQAVLENSGYKARILPVATKEDLLTGREVADIGQCCPTSFTTGNLVNFLKKESKQVGVEAVNEKYVYLTAGSCGACRFGQYHASYELALRNSGLERFRMFLMAQDNLDQNMGDGLDLNLPMTLGCLWGIFCTDLVQDLEYQVRPYEVRPGQTAAVVQESVEHLYQVFRSRPALSPKKSVLWHLTTPYFARAMREVHRKFSEIEVDRLRQARGRVDGRVSPGGGRGASGREEQTAGQGRHGHIWHSEKGSGLYLSVVLPRESTPALTMALGLATAEAITTSTRVACDLRWPNDIMIGNRKAAVLPDPVSDAPTRSRPERMMGIARR
jgi:hypothetical protein